MDSEEVHVIQSPEAQQIKAYCYTLQRQLELPVMRAHWWVHDVLPRPDAPYILKVNAGPLGSPWFPFTQYEIAGYLMRISTASVQDRIRMDLKARLDAAERRSALALDNSIDVTQPAVTLPAASPRL